MKGSSDVQATNPITSHESCVCAVKHGLLKREHTQEKGADAVHAGTHGDATADAGADAGDDAGDDAGLMLALTPAMTPA